MIRQILGGVIDSSILMGMMIAILLILRRFQNRRYAIKYWYWIWLVISLRLILPVGGNISVNLGEVWGKSIAINKDISESIEIHENEGLFKEHLIEEARSESVKLEETNLEEARGYLSHSSNGRKEEKRIIEVSIIVWVLVASILIIYQWVMYWIFCRECKRWGKVCTDEKYQEIFQELCKELQIKRFIQLKQCKKVTSPLAMGFIKPAILLPEKVYGDKEIYLILKHELIHYKRGDLWYKLLLVGVKRIHWFNPFVYRMVEHAEEDLEMFCDDEVLIESSLADKKRYMEIILETAHQNRAYGMSFSVPLRGGKKMLQKRFSHILDKSNKKKGKGILILVVCSSLLCGSIGILRASQTNVGVAVDLEKTNVDNISMISFVDRGYKISIPDTWEIVDNPDDRDGFGLYNGQDQVGAVKLIKEVSSREEIENVFDLTGIKSKGKDTYLEKKKCYLLETIFEEDNQSGYIQYVFYDLPNPPPYAYAIYLNKQKVEEALIDKIMNSFMIQGLEFNMYRVPDKNREPMALEEAKLKTTCKVTRIDGSKEVYNVALIDEFMALQERRENTTLEIIEYIETDEGMKIKNWNYLYSEGKEVYCIGYYEQEDGTFTYDNMRLAFKRISKKVYDEEGVIAYRLIDEEGTDSTRLFEGIIG